MSNTVEYIDEILIDSPCYLESALVRNNKMTDSSTVKSYDDYKRDSYDITLLRLNFSNGKTVEMTGNLEYGNLDKYYSDIDVTLLKKWVDDKHIIKSVIYRYSNREECAEHILILKDENDICLIASDSDNDGDPPCCSECWYKVYIDVV